MQITATATKTTFGRLAGLADWELQTMRGVPTAGTPECDALVACASQPDLTDHDLDCAVVHDRMLSRRLRLEAEVPA